MSLFASVYLGFELSEPGSSIYLVGETTHGHHQIEMACKVCHKKAFGGEDVLQEACMDCHGEEMKVVDDSHPKSKFTDPRNAERVANLDARLCVTCHREHRPRISGPMGVTLPDDFCFHCHADIGKDRPSHKALPFETCASAGCHNFHDNRALYEDFLLKHSDAPDLLPMPKVAIRTRSRRVLPVSDRQDSPLTPQDADAPPEMTEDLQLMSEWLESSHAKNGVNCRDCHTLNKDVDGPGHWSNTPNESVCQSCHEGEAKGFFSGKHGMRLVSNLPGMNPALAKANMKPDAGDKPLGCVSCHGAHAFDTLKAAVQACMQCHNDPHSRAYAGSPHDELFQNEIKGIKKPGTGVSCATCHMPRFAKNKDDMEVVSVQHNQSWNLRPNEKMIREVCLNCHGLRFSIDALADKRLIEKNFKGRPSRRVESIDWAKKRNNEKKEKKAAREPSHAL